MTYSTVEASLVSVVASDLQEVMMKLVAAVLTTLKVPRAVEAFTALLVTKMRSVVAMFVFATVTVPLVSVAVPMKSVAAPPWQRNCFAAPLQMIFPAVAVISVPAVTVVVAETDVPAETEPAVAEMLPVVAVRPVPAVIVVVDVMEVVDVMLPGATKVAERLKVSLLAPPVTVIWFAVPRREKLPAKGTSAPPLSPVMVTIAPVVPDPRAIQFPVPGHMKAVDNVVLSQRVPLT